MVGMAWVANMNTISLFQQIRYVVRRIKGVLLYDVNFDKGELMSYPVSLTSL